MIHPFLQRLNSGTPILADGAMGTLLYERLGFRYVCFEELNVTNPEIVQSAHRSYLSAGAELVETNTFGCNRFLLASRGLEGSVERFARAGARIAREAQEAMGVEAYIAGAIGPVNRLGITTQDVRAGFEEVVQGLLLGGVDLLCFETFGSLDELLLAIEVAHSCSSLPVMASMTFSEEGLTLAGEDPARVAEALSLAGADVIGANCGFGPQPTLEVVERMRHGSTPQAAMPNAGLPARIDGRLVYSSGPDYFAEYTKKFVASGVLVIGGCCGTTPAHIAQMRNALSEMDPQHTPSEFSPPLAINYLSDDDQAAERLERETGFQRALRERQFVISVEMRPSRGTNVRKVLRNAELLRDAGVTAVDVTDSALGRVRMNPFFTAYLIQAHTGLDVVSHLTTRDRNVMALQADLLGAHAVGIRHVLCLTGDPPNPNSLAPATGVYDLDSIGLIALLRKLNQGQDAAGTSIGSGTNFLIGCSLNPTAENLDNELDRFRRKVEAGADFVMTQAVYDPELFLNVLHRVGPLTIPVILEILPLQSFKNAEFIHNELAGVTLPESVLERMRAAGAQAADEGMRIARETFEALAPYVEGVYIIPAFDRYEQAAELARDFRKRADSLRVPARA